jgi:CheY-like chemotaxis protein
MNLEQKQNQSNGINPQEGAEVSPQFPVTAIETDLDRVHAAAIKAVFGMTGVPFSPVVEEAQAVICQTPVKVLENLKAGRAVVHLGTRSNDRPLQGVLSNPAFAASYRFITNQSIVLLAGLTALSELAGSPLLEHQTVLVDAGLTALSEMAKLSPRPDIVLPELSPAPVHDKKIVVVDDQQLNLKSAVVQLGPKNDVVAFDNYAAFFKAIDRETPEIVLLDLLMPAEGAQLGGQAMQSFLGSPITAGIFAALAASQKGVPLIVIATDAGHHDHPALALIDELGWNKPISLGTSTLVIVQAKIVDGVKDWGESIVAAIKAQEQE